MAIRAQNSDYEAVLPWLVGLLFLVAATAIIGWGFAQSQLAQAIENDSITVGSIR